MVFSFSLGDENGRPLEKPDFPPLSAQDFFFFPLENHYFQQTRMVRLVHTPFCFPLCRIKASLFFFGAPFGFPVVFLHRNVTILHQVLAFLQGPFFPSFICGNV